MEVMFHSCFLFSGIEVNSATCSTFSDSSARCENICTDQNVSVCDKDVAPPAICSEDNTSSSASNTNVTQHNLQNINDNADNENSNDGHVQNYTVFESKEEALTGDGNGQRYLCTSTLFLN